jgi:DNA-binding HxlR family transcriptional regulator
LEENMLGELDCIVLETAYRLIGQSRIKRVAGSTVWEAMQVLVPDIAPVTIPARLRRLVSLGLLEKDEANSSNRTKLYGPTEAGYEQLTEVASV